MALLDDHDFRDWLRTERGIDLDNLELRAHVAPCEGCDSSGFPIFGTLNQCLVCLSGDYGRACADRRISDAVRGFLNLFLAAPPMTAARLLLLTVDGVAEAVSHVQMEQAAQPEGEHGD